MKVIKSDRKLKSGNMGNKLRARMDEWAFGWVLIGLLYKHRTNKHWKVVIDVNRCSSNIRKYIEINLFMLKVISPSTHSSAGWTNFAALSVETIENNQNIPDTQISRFNKLGKR